MKIFGFEVPAFSYKNSTKAPADALTKCDASTQTKLQFPGSAPPKYASERPNKEIPPPVFPLLTETPMNFTIRNTSISKRKLPETNDQNNKARKKCRRSLTDTCLSNSRPCQTTNNIWLASDFTDTVKASQSGHPDLPVNTAPMNLTVSEIDELELLLNSCLDLPV